MMEPFFEVMEGHVLDRLRELPAECVQMAITSPPYFGLRSYGTEPQVWGGDHKCTHDWDEPATLHVQSGGTGKSGLNRDGRSEHARAEGQARTVERSSVNAHQKQGATSQRQGRSNVEAQRNDYRSLGCFCRLCGAWKGELGLEPDFELYIDHLLEVFREVRRVLRDDGTFWLNIGDSYAGSGKGQNKDGQHNMKAGDKQMTSKGTLVGGLPVIRASTQRRQAVNVDGIRPRSGLESLPNKSLMGIPWRVADAMQGDGWILRNAVVWNKTNPMPGSQMDRFTSSYEFMFLFAKRGRYFFDMEAVKEDAVGGHPSQNKARKLADGTSRDRLDTHMGSSIPWDSEKRTPRDVWSFPTAPYRDAHFATFPPRLVETPILAGSPEMGSCSACGAPWRRIVAVWYENPGNRTTNGPRSLENRGFTAGFEERLVKKTETLGFQPSCVCLAPREPAVVLDPFIGSGTTAVVALNLGRSCIGIELNPEYAQMARDRVKKESKRVSA